MGNKSTLRNDQFFLPVYSSPYKHLWDILPALTAGYSNLKSVGETVTTVQERSKKLKLDFVSRNFITLL